MPIYWADSTPITEKTSPFDEKKCSFTTIGLHLRRSRCQIDRNRLRTSAIFTVFLRFGPIQLHLKTPYELT